MVQLPTSLCEIAGLAPDATTSDLLDILRAGPHDFLDGLLTSEDSKIAAAASLESFPKYRLRIGDQVGTLQYKFCSVNVRSHSNPVLIGLIDDSYVEAPPTALENLIFWAIIDDKLPWHQSKLVVGGRSTVDWRSLAKGKAIIAEPMEQSLDVTDQQVISALFGLLPPEMPATTSPIPLVSVASAVKMDALSGRYSATQARLLFEASSIQHPKWRFLSFYRILENAYLTNIKEALLDDFDFDATKAIDTAKSKLASEANQLVSLAERADLATDFEVFNAEFDALIGDVNKYITKLDRSSSSEQLYKAQETYKKAILRFYKMRCSIAHAGTSSVIYEQFSDADAAMLRLLPSVETIALKSLKIFTV